MGIFLYSALVIDGNLIYMQEVGDVSSLVLHDFLVI